VLYSQPFYPIVIPGRRDAWGPMSQPKCLFCSRPAHTLIYSPPTLKYIWRSQMDDPSGSSRLLNRLLAETADKEAEAYFRFANDPHRSLSVTPSRRVRLPARVALPAPRWSACLGIAFVSTSRRGPMGIPPIEGGSPIRAVVHIPGKCTCHGRHSGADCGGNAKSNLRLGKHFISPAVLFVVSLITSLSDVRTAGYSCPYRLRTSRQLSPIRKLLAARVAPQRSKLLQFMPPERSQNRAAAGRHGAKSRMSMA
jgi:hypothetical protein